MAAYTQQQFKKILAAAKVPAHLIPIIIAQVQHETNNFRDKKIFDHNNASGIIWLNKPAVQKNASKGRVLPETKNSSKPYYYAKFASLKDWLTDYLRILNRAPNYPLKATSLTDYVTRLKSNGYFTDSAQNYLKGLAKYLRVKMPAAGTSDNTIIVAVVAGAVLLFLLSNKKRG